MPFKQAFPKVRLLFVYLLLFSFFIVQPSCTKIDNADLTNRALTDAEVTQKFFDLPANAPLAVKRAAAEMKSKNAASEFVKAFVKNNGYPVWDKALIPAQPLTSVSFSGNVQVTDTVIIIPVVPQNAAFVSSFVRATLNGSARFEFFRGNDYAAYTFNDVPADSVNADKAAMQIMILDKLVFGYTKFRVVDKRLFHPSSDYSDTGHISRTLTLSGDQPFSGGNTSNLFQTCMLVTNTTTTNHCPYPPGQCTGINGTCDNCAAVCASVVSESHLVCSVWYDDSGGSTTGSPDPGGGPGGGPMPDPGFPCAGSQGRNIGIADPCGPTNPPPVVPIPPVPGCDPFITILQNDADFNDKLNLLRNGDYSAQFERGYKAVGIGGSLYIPMDGELNAAEIKINYFPGQPFQGVMHHHYAGLAPMFSPGDVVSMAETFLTGYAMIPKDLFYTVSGIDNAGNKINYMMKISDTAKFRIFANKIASSALLKERFKFKYSDAFSFGDNNDLNEKGFLSMMADFGINNGFDLYRGDDSGTNVTWERLYLSGNKNDPPGTPFALKVESQNCN